MVFSVAVEPVNVPSACLAWIADWCSIAALKSGNFGLDSSRTAHEPPFLLFLYSSVLILTYQNEDPMHVSTKTITEYPWFIRLFFWNQKRRYGKVLEPGMLWGRSPWVFATLALLYGALDRKRSPISPVLRSLITVRVSQINHCEFCVDINSATLLKRGVSENKIEALWEWQESPLFDQTERVALAYTEAVTHSELRVDNDLVARVKEHFDDDAVVELTGLIAFQNLSSKFNDALNVAPQGFCRLPTVPPSDKS